VRTFNLNNRLVVCPSSCIAASLLFPSDARSLNVEIRQAALPSCIENSFDSKYTSIVACLFVLSASTSRKFADGGQARYQYSQACVMDM
jgi:hypothetical protein